MAYRLHLAGLASGNSQHSYHCSCDRCGYTFGRIGNWFKVQNDSSTGDNGGEIVSSVLTWAHDNDLPPSPWPMMQMLENILVHQVDAPTDQNCGMHVHVGVRDLTDRQLGRLFELVHHNEAILFRLACGRYRTHRGYRNQFNYCLPLSAFDNPLDARELVKAKSAEARRSTIGRQKYVAANLMPISTLGTVEFRLWESTRSAWRMRLYSQLSVALVERAKNRRAPAGRAVYLGQEVTDDDFNLFLRDLELFVPELVDERFVADAHRQWTEAPARQQPRPELRPIQHFDNVGRPTSDVTRVASVWDTHANLVAVINTDDTPAPRSSRRGPPPLRRAPRVQLRYENAPRLADDSPQSSIEEAVEHLGIDLDDLRVPDLGDQAVEALHEVLDRESAPSYDWSNPDNPEVPEEEDPEARTSRRSTTYREMQGLIREEMRQRVREADRRLASYGESRASREGRIDE